MNGQQFQFIYHLYLLLTVVVINIALVSQTMADSEQQQQPDLYCLNRLDSIEYIPVKDMYFITSGGYYWYIAAKSFPPKEPTGKLPEPFKRGDAAIYLDKQSVCQNNARAPKVAKSPTEQVVLVMERQEDGSRQVHTFDTKTSKWSDQAISFNSDDILKKTKIDSTTNVTDIFSIRVSQIYVLMENRYAGVEWKNICLADGQANGYQPQERDTINLPSRVKVDAATVINTNRLYVFHGQQYRTIDISDTQSAEGILGQTTASGDNPLRQFFKFGDNKTEADCSSKPTGGDGNGNDKPSNGANGDNTDNPNKPDSSGDSNTATKKDDGGGGISGLTIALVGVVVVIVLIVAAVLLTFFLSRKKSSTATSGNVDGGQNGSAKGATGAGRVLSAKSVATKQPPPPPSRQLRSSIVAPKSKAVPKK